MQNASSARTSRYSSDRSRPSFKKTSSSRHSSSRPQGGRPPRRDNRGQGNARRRRVMPTFNPSQFINKNPQELQQETYTPVHTFANIGLDQRIVQTLHDIGITIPTPIQDQIIPHILKGTDVVGLAETGTGKTAAFLLPIIQKTIHDPKFQTLIMAPTRELAIQIHEELKKLSRGFRIYGTICVGGTSMRPQLQALSRHQHVIIGTPGRLLDMIERGALRPSTFSAVVLDEADRMLDMGFIQDMKKILQALPKEHQTLCFSATMNQGTKDLVQTFLSHPVSVSVKKRDITNSIAQDVVSYYADKKFETLLRLLNDQSFARVIIFGEMKHSVQKLAEELNSHKISTEALHGNKSHAQRQRALQNFKSGRVRVLVATDVAARGIHVDGVSHVINYDLPQTFEDYTHRIGRTGRGSAMGQALTFIPSRS